MGDFNNNQGPFDPVTGQPINVPQNSNENTYWETQPNQGYSQQYSDQSGQNYNQSQPYAGQPGQYTNQPGQYSDQPGQYTNQSQQYTGQQYTSQPGQYSDPNQQIYGQVQQNYGQTPPNPGYSQQYTGQTEYSHTQNQSNTYNQQPKKKSKLPIVAIIVLLVLVTGSVAAYANRVAIMNTFAQMTKSPAEYYSYVEKKAIGESIDSMKPYLATASGDMGVDAQYDVTFDRNTIDSLMQSTMGTSLSDFESSIGIPIEGFGANLLIGKNDNKISESMGLRFNNVDIITAEFFIDTAANQFLMKCPELSDAYVNLFSTDIDTNAALSALQMPDADKTADFLNRYSNIIVDNLSTVEMDKNYELELDTISTNCTKLTVTLSNEDVYNILEDILKESRDDEYIIDMLSACDITKADYQSEIDSALDELSTSKETLLESDLQMIVYVDSDSNIIGREFSSEEFGTPLGYTIITKGKDSEYNLYLKDETGNEVFNVTGTQTKSGEAYSGKATIRVTDPTGYNFSSVTFNLEYEDFQTKLVDNHYYQYGTFTLASPELMGVSIISESSVKDDTQINELKLQMGGSTLVTIASTMKYLDDFKVEGPSSDSVIYNYDDIDSYTESLDIESYISDLSSKLGIDLQSLYENYYYGYDY